MSGVLHGVVASLKAAAAAATDAFFEYVSLLLNTSATNGAQNNTFLDSSTNNFTVTRNGDTTQGSFNPYMPSGYWSGFFDGTGDYLTVPSNAAFGLGTGDFTIEMWVYATANPANGPGTILDLRTGATATATSVRIDSSLSVLFYDGPLNLEINVGTIALNTWTHIAHARASGSLKTYINGTLSNTTAVTSDLGSNQPCMIGNNQTAGYAWNGYISNFRIVKGTAVYTSAFTPPTTPLTAITNTSLLCLQDNRFKDNSTNAFAITVNGDTRISKFAPFNPPASYSTASYGGSGFFDGTGDDLRLSTNAAFALGTGDFTFDVWINPSNWTNSVVPFFVVSGTGGFWVGKNGSNFVVRAFDVADQLTYGTLPTVGAWTHIVAVRSGTTLSMYYNGTRVATTTNSYNFAQAALAVGGDGDTVPIYYTGYISNARLVKGTAVYDPTQTTLTVPTTPLTAITNTSLLLNFTNAGIYDAATINDGQTVGNAQVSTTQAKWGTTSMYFDGAASSRLVFPARPEIAFGTGNFTIEGWVYRADTNNRGVFQISGTTGGLAPTTTNNLALSSEAGQVWQIYCNNSNYLSTATWSTNTWYHFALVRNSGTTKLYIDGTSVISQADTTNYTGQNLCVGGYYSTVFVMNGYIQDLRITNGVARYTANFTPPTAAFPTL